MPRIVDVAQRRDDVVRAVLDVLDGSGVDGVTIRAVAERAGISAGLVHHYFPGGRTELLHATVTAGIDRGLQRMMAVLDSATGLAALRGVALELLPLEPRRRREWSAWASLWGTVLSDPDLRQEQRERLDAWRALLVTLLDQAVEAGEVPSTCDTVATAQRCAALLDGLGFHALVQPDLVTAQVLTDQLDRFLSEVAA